MRKRRRRKPSTSTSRSRTRCVRRAFGPDFPRFWMSSTRARWRIRTNADCPSRLGAAPSQDNSEVHFKVKHTTKFEKVRAPPRALRLRPPRAPRRPPPLLFSRSPLTPPDLRPHPILPAPDLQRLLRPQVSPDGRRALPLRRRAHHAQPNPERRACAGEATAEPSRQIPRNPRTRRKRRVRTASSSGGCQHFWPSGLPRRLFGARAPPPPPRRRSPPHQSPPPSLPQLDMEDGDSIDAMMEQVGGC